MRVLITGITGFVGSHLAEYVLEHHPGCEIWGLKRWRSPRGNVSGLDGKVAYHDGDLRDLSSLLGLFKAVQPDVIFHLAAQSYVLASYAQPADTCDTNVTGTVNLLEAVRLSGLDPVIHVCSSSEVYGQVDPKDVPITENCPLRPVSPYGVSKVGEDMAAFMYHKAYGLRTIRSRMFTHSGPRRGKVFVDSAFALQVAKIERGLQPPVVRVGNLDSVRTFADVRDTVRAYWLLVTKGVPGDVYNIGGETTMTVGEMLDMLLGLTSFKGRIDVNVDPALIRPADVTLQVPCTEKFQRQTGWNPEIPYEQTLLDMLDYWRKQVIREVAVGC